ncbi:geranylgeranylglyceryl/heptaprenylglyceryl phosphate synthase [bacterium]|nr:geranylgeranylglyceryl/heptaprenylglyceryl phosphate synthase [bacterium]RQV92219.1 MAG: geranylgeranylglyceryl/heptaprenylglyceryl phosphate synthase [bacterium]
MTVYQKLIDVVQKKGAGYLVLLDPDECSREDCVSLARDCEANGVDALLIGGSILFSVQLDELVKAIKEVISIPVILFPGNGRQLSKYADGILFLSLISGRNPNYLIGEQVLSAPIIQALGLEPISTGYILIESGKTTTVEFMSNTRPLPREKPEIAMAHALAAEYFGMKLVYLECGSGAELTVPEEIIRSLRKALSIPIMVGGGIRTPETALLKVKAGASFIVTGNILENGYSPSLIQSFAQAIHHQGKEKFKSI